MELKIRVNGITGQINWSPRGYWTIRVGDYHDTENLEPKYLEPPSGKYDGRAIEETKKRLIDRAKLNLKKK